MAIKIFIRKTNICNTFPSIINTAILKYSIWSLTKYIGKSIYLTWCSSSRKSYSTVKLFFCNRYSNWADGGIWMINIITPVIFNKIIKSSFSLRIPSRPSKTIDFFISSRIQFNPNVPVLDTPPLVSVAYPASQILQLSHNNQP